MSGPIPDFGYSGRAEPQPKNVLVCLSPTEAFHVDYLVRTGLYGEDPEAVLLTMMRQGLQAAASHGWLRRPPQGTQG